MNEDLKTNYKTPGLSLNLG